MKFPKQSPFNLNKTEIEISYVERDSNGNEKSRMDCAVKLTNKAALLTKQFFELAIKSGKKIDIQSLFK